MKRLIDNTIGISFYDTSEALNTGILFGYPCEAKWNISKTYENRNYQTAKEF